MRFVITATTERSEPAEAPDDAIFAAYMQYNEEMAKAGVLIAAEGLNPDAPGARIGIVDGQRTVLDGPYPETKELLGGLYLIEVESLEEAIAWALRSPVGMGSDDVLDVRPLTRMSDLPPRLQQTIRDLAPTWGASWSQ